MPNQQSAALAPPAGTPAGYWNNYTGGGSGDLGDWAQNANPPGSGYTPDAYNDGSSSDIDNPLTSTDVTLLNVLGYDLATPTLSQSLPPADVPITVGEFLTDVSLNEVVPGSSNAPAGEAYFIVDTAFDIEPLTASEITAGETIGLHGIVATDASVVLTVAQAEASEGSCMDGARGARGI